MKKIILYFLIFTSIFGMKLIDGNYTLTEKVVRGKKWKSIIIMEVENQEIKKLKYDMITEEGKYLTESNELDKLIKVTKGINPYEELPKRYLEKINKNDNPHMATLDGIAGATEPTYKFNKMMLFLMEKAKKGETGEFKGWF